MSPKFSGSSEFGYFHEEIHGNSPEKWQPWCKIVNIQSSCETSSAIFNTYRETILFYTPTFRNKIYGKGWISASIEIPPFQTQIYLVKIFTLKILRSEVWKGGFQLMQITGLLGMYFDAVVVDVKKYIFFLIGHTANRY